MSNNAQNFLTIQKGAFSALVLPQNVAKVETALAKLEKPSKRDPFKRSRYDNARSFPRFVSGMSTGEYVSLYNAANHGLKLTDIINANDYPRPAAEYAPGVPLCVEDANPDYNPADDIAPAKTKRVSKQAQQLEAMRGLLYTCLPFIEDAHESGAYKTTRTAELIRDIRAAIGEA